KVRRLPIAAPSEMLPTLFRFRLLPKPWQFQPQAFLRSTDRPEQVGFLLRSGFVLRPSAGRLENMPVRAGRNLPAIVVDWPRSRLYNLAGRDPLSAFLLRTK